MSYIDNEILERLIGTMVDLGVSQRTLARYRQEGKIKYYSVEKNGKSFYLASEIQSFLLQRGKNVVNNK